MKSSEKKKENLISAPLLPKIYSSNNDLQKKTTENTSPQLPCILLTKHYSFFKPRPN